MCRDAVIYAQEESELKKKLKKMSKKKQEEAGEYQCLSTK
jgi:hypothetical protein